MQLSTGSLYEMAEAADYLHLLLITWRNSGYKWGSEEGIQGGYGYFS